MPDRILSSPEYQTLVEQAPILIWRSDLSMGCNYFNERWLKYTGRTMEQELGNGWAAGVHPEDFDECLKIYTASFAKREIFEMEYRLRRHDGAWRWILDRGVPFSDAQGEFAGYIGSCVDVHERREAQEAAKKAHAREVTALRELLPICASCKKIRNDTGYWERIERYFQVHKDVRFTHSICPECCQKLYGNIEDVLPEAQRAP